MIEEKIIADVYKKEKQFLSLLKHEKISKISSRGLMIAVHFNSFETNKKIIDALIEKGVFTDWFLFAPNALRISPPLNISEEDITKACKIIIETLDETVVFEMKL